MTHLTWIYIYVLESFVFSELIFGHNDTECHREMSAHMKCMQSKRRENYLQDDETIRNAKNRIINCFTDNNCSPPELNFENAISSYQRPRKLRHQDTLANENHSKFDSSLLKEVERCIRNRTENTAVNKLNECLQSQGVAELNDIPPTHDHRHGNGTEDGFRSFFVLHRVIGQSILKCKRQTDESTAYEVAICAHSVKSEMKLGLCPRLLACENEEVSIACRQRSSDIRHALCKCRQERLQEAVENIEMLKLSDGGVDRSELINALSHVDENIRRKIIRQCRSRYGLAADDFKDGDDKTLYAAPNLVDSNRANSSLVSQAQLDDTKFLLLIKLKEEDCAECVH